MSECERLWDARARAWGMNVIIGKLQKWSSPTPPSLKKWLIKDLIKHPIPIPYYSSRPTTPLLPPSRLSDRVLKPCHHLQQPCAINYGELPPSMQCPPPKPIESSFPCLSFLRTQCQPKSEMQNWAWLKPKTEREMLCEWVHLCRTRASAYLFNIINTGIIYHLQALSTSPL